MKKDSLRWYGHVMRMEEERIPTKLLHTKMERKRPRKTHDKWIDQIRKNLEIRGENQEEMQENRMWENRGGWRFFYNIRQHIFGND